MEKRTALIIVDVQRDFLPGGALAVPDGDAILPEIKRLTEEVRSDINLHQGEPDLIFASRDWHPEDHVSFGDGKWPVHCVQRTRGAELPTPVIEAFAHRFLGRLYSKGTDAGVEQYSALPGVNGFGETLEDTLHRLKVTDLIVTGLALDYCVKATALDAAEAGYSVTVPLSATRAVTTEGAEAAMNELEAAQVALA